MATSRMAMITFLDGDGYGGRPDNSLPGGGRPDNSLPGGGYPGNALPGGPVYPGNALPGGGHISLLPVFPFDPTRPDNELPGGGGGDTMPIRPGRKFVVKWLACQGLILVPDNELPSTPPPTTDNTLPPTAEPKA